MKTKLRFLICLVAALAGFMLLSQLVLAYTYSGYPGGHWEPFRTVNPFSIPWLLFLILVLVIVTVASVTLSFLTKGRTKAEWTKVGIGMSWILGISFFILGIGIPIGSYTIYYHFNTPYGIEGVPIDIKSVDLREPLLIPFGIALWVTASILQQRGSTIKVDDWVLNINKSRGANQSQGANRISIKFSKAVEARLLPGEKVIAGISAGRSEFVATDKRLFRFSAGRCKELEYTKISEVSHKGPELAALIGLIFCVVITLWIVVEMAFGNPDILCVIILGPLCIAFLGLCLWGIKSLSHGYYQIESQTFDKTALKGWRLPCHFHRARVDEFVKTIEALKDEDMRRRAAEALGESGDKSPSPAPH